MNEAERIIALDTQLMEHATQRYARLATKYLKAVKTYDELEKKLTRQERVVEAMENVLQAENPLWKTFVDREIKRLEESSGE